MPRKIEELEMQAAAYLYSEKYSQNEIKEILTVSQSTVSRSIQWAQDTELLEVSLRFIREKISPERMLEIETRVSPQQQLKKQLEELARENGHPTGPNVRVFPNATYRGTTQQTAWDLRFEWFGQVVAEHIRDLLRQSEVCGVSWGSTVAGIARGLGKLGSSSLHKGHPIQFIPLCGEPFGADALAQFSSSSLAKQFDGIMNGGTSHSFSIAAVPAFVPREFNPDEMKTIYRLIRHVVAYRDIFQSKDEEETPYEPWIDRLDAVLTSVSSAERPMGGYWDDALLRAGGIDREKLQQLVVGETCGILFSRPALSTTELVELAEINDRWTGITEQQMKRCADNASKNGKAGVIIVAAGKDKVASVYESVRHGLVNHLAINRDLADALTQKISGSQPIV